MPCYHLKIAWREAGGRNPITGKWPLVFCKENGDPTKEVKLPCGHCIGCKLEKSRQWAIRCVHEASLYDKNCFLTLTYNEDNVKEECSKNDIQKFIKRLRKWHGGRLSYFVAGEHGRRRDRTHYHAAIFNCDFRDKKYWSKTGKGSLLYVSPQLDKLWGMGFATVADVNFESTAYIARYCVKMEKKKEDEFLLMSTKPALGRTWLEQYAEEVYAFDEVSIRGGRKCRPPRYYDKIASDVIANRMEEIKKKRLEKMKEINWRRLRNGEKIKIASLTGRSL